MSADVPDSAELELLRSEGAFVRTAWLPARVAEEAASACRQVQGFEAAGVGRGADRRMERTIRGDKRVWIDPAAPPPGLAPVVEALEAVREHLNREAMLGLSRTELQLARYPGEGARYQRHRDSFRGQQGRRVTAIFYLNPGWQPAHGGSLRLHPEGRPPIEVAPLLNTLLVFLSEEVEHEVLPSFAARYALTAWWSGSQLFSP